MRNINYGSDLQNKNAERLIDAVKIMPENGFVREPDRYGYMSSAKPNQLRPKLGVFILLGILAIAAAFVSATHKGMERPSWGFIRSTTSSSSSSSSSPPSSPDDIDGGGWTVVRCVSSSEGTWHPATDQLAGTDQYGTYDAKFTTNPTTFSIKWKPENYSQVLLGYSDLSFWLLVEMNTIFTIGSNFPASILKSSKAPNGPSYTALWYNRYHNAEDPWASVYDHGDDDPGMVYGGNSKSGHMEHLGDAADGVGACVWLR